MDQAAANKLIDRYLRSASAQDFDDLHDIFTDDVAIDWPQSGEHFQGKDACVNVFVNYPGGSPRILGLRRLTGEGSVWVGEAEMLYPDQSKWTAIGIYELRDGKIAHETDYFAQPFPVPEWRKQMTGTE
jgi:SnoaL-like domain